jgi:phosphonate degradation associated HDIG domain protein
MAEAMIDRLHGLFRARGAEAYLGEPVTVAVHMLQCAALARAEAAPDTLVAAALLHDVGHLIGGGDHALDDGVDHGHEQAAADFLAGHLPPAVVEPIRLHVAAKRYLCATDGAYFERLTMASRHSLLLQGGVMTAAEIASFECEPFHREAIRVRGWDDGGKTPGRTTPTFEDHLPLLHRLTR